MKELTSKIKSVSIMARLAARARAAGKTVVAASGSYDVLHYGHVAQLAQAKRHGDILLALLNSDASVRRYKGPGHPIQPQAARAVVLAGLASVDGVAIFDELTPVQALERIKPDIFVQGAEWGKNCVERAAVASYGGRIVVAKQVRGFSTTDLVKTMSRVGARSVVRAVFVDRDGTINIDRGALASASPCDFVFVPRAVAALRRLSRMSYKIIVVTNQASVARGYFTQRALDSLHRWMVSALEARGARIDRVYYCPHAPDAGCACRKPEVGMLLRAAKDFDLCLGKSWMIGDDARDVLAGRHANVQTIKISGRMPAKSLIQPHYYARDLWDAVERIGAEERKNLAGAR